MANARVTVKTDLRKIETMFGSANVTQARVVLANQMLLDITPFVPMREGDLRASGHVTGGGESLEWSELYARAQFFGTNGIVTFHNYHTPGTGPHWDEAASDLYLTRWKEVYLEALGL